MFDFSGSLASDSLEAGSSNFQNAIANAIGNAIASMIKEFLKSGS